jgi:hypothetical protein
VISTEGSFHAGIGGAEPGFAQAPRSGGGSDRRVRRQVLVLERSATSVPFGSAAYRKNTRLEPDVLDNKYYVKGIGEVAGSPSRVHPNPALRK